MNYEIKLQYRLNYYKITVYTNISARDLIDRYKKCAYCGEPLDENNYSVEHIENPTSKDDFKRTAEIKNNIVLCCRTCNRSKSNKTLKEWFKNLNDGKTSFLPKKIIKIKEHTSTSKNEKIKLVAERIFKDN